LESSNLRSGAAMPDKPVKWRWACYGLIVGLAICIATLVL